MNAFWNIVIMLFVIGGFAGLTMGWLLRKSNYSGPDECFTCNKETCEGCPMWSPVIQAIESAYISRAIDGGKVVASATLTFDKDFVVAQCPPGGDKGYQIPNMIGCYKTAVIKWADCGNGNDVRSARFTLIKGE
jgi:hypothetical protein